MNETKTEYKFGDIILRDSSCTAYPTNIGLKDFPFLAVCSLNAFFNKELTKTEDGETKSHEVSLTGKELLRFFNEAVKIEYKNGVLHISTPKYNLWTSATRKELEGRF